ncbi:hypothetical protein JTB14_016519 [Gonioctena quinquepunctata]|nr:hypothetical protein JTB14_016519 [Gonioctena quinquepunctata]
MCDSPPRKRDTFYSATKNKEENVQEWAARVRQLAGKCEFQDELELFLRDRFICGFPKGRLFEEKSENFTFQKAIGIAGNKEASSRKCHEVVIKSEPWFEPGVYHLGGKRNAKGERQTTENTNQSAPRGSNHFAKPSSSTAGAGRIARLCDVCSKIHPPPCRILSNIDRGQVRRKTFLNYSEKATLAAVEACYNGLPFLTASKQFGLI